MPQAAMALGPSAGFAEQDEGAETRFDTGHEVSAIACALLPAGVMVEAEPDLAAALATTRALLDGGYDGPIFEATLEHDGVLVRIDVLEPVGASGWHMAEVKSSTKAKDYHVGDLATQISLPLDERRLMLPCGLIAHGIRRR